MKLEEKDRGKINEFKIKLVGQKKCYQTGNIVVFFYIICMCPSYIELRTKDFGQADSPVL